ncbi:MAG: bifunctional orotidine-5'-phosphate decarboxylase/orotate phosphoribosyltransferase, partial [Leptolyngbyaceae cyanobacterium SM1_3_5]|nr:bifunctional orotidine-5'-phosphate decarboxylase/orotate phosphoribosyltransferase [Leptolyngbyaceae cyanobacterium SM1_3_5]
MGTTAPEVMATVRSIAPERLILVRSIWANPDSLNDILAAGLNNNGEGLLIPVPQDWLASDRLTEQVRSLNQTINLGRETVRQSGSSCDLWLSNLPNFGNHPQQNLIVQLFDIGCILLANLCRHLAQFSLL